MLYNHPRGDESPQNLELMREIDRLHLDHPYYGSRRVVACLAENGFEVNRKRVQRLRQLMNIEAVYPKPNTSKGHPEHKIYPYLLRNMAITHPNHVWSTDITYIPMKRGFMYLAVIMDWFSRYVLTWQISNTLEGHFCREILEDALKLGVPEIFNSDQGVQFTSQKFRSILEGAGVRISMDGRGRALDNVFVERLWRTVKYEHIYLHAYDTGVDLFRGLEGFFEHYNNRRPHQSLGYKKPAEIFQGILS